MKDFNIDYEIARRKAIRKIERYLEKSKRYSDESMSGYYLREKYKAMYYKEAAETIAKSWNIKIGTLNLTTERYCFE